MARVRDNRRRAAKKTVAARATAVTGCDPKKALRDLRKKAEAALIETQARLRALIDNTADTIWSVDPGYRLTIGNKAFVAALKAFSGREIRIGDSVLQDVLPPGMREYWRANYRRALSGEKFKVESRTPTGYGGIRWREHSFNPIRGGDGAVIGVACFSRDITAHKQMEEEITQKHEQLRSLAKKLTETEETGRKRVSQELHDQIGQNLSAIGLNLEIMRSQIDAGTGALLSRVNDTIDLVRQTTERTRNLMAELRPPALDDLGLVAALRWRARDFSARTGIETLVEGDEFSPRVSPEKETSLFRIAQEALTNVAKHARATKVTISVGSNDGVVRLSVADNGIGFERFEKLSTGGLEGWGIMNMIERARGEGGECRMESAPGRGTRIVVDLPK